jgi:hypothetical protein
MPPGSIKQMADHVAALMQQRLHVGGASLAEKLRRGGRALPRSVRSEAAFLAEASRQATNPRLLPLIDRDRVARAHDICLRHLQGLDRKARRRAALMGIASSIAFSLFAVGVLAVVVLWWRGFL